MNETAYLVFDSETVPDGKLLAAVKYPGEGLTADQAVDKARAEAVEASWTGSDFLPYTFQVPVAVCVLRVGQDYKIQACRALDAPEFRPAEIVRQFWKGLYHYEHPTLVTFNGRGFDIPLLELGAFKLGLQLQHHINKCRHRYNSGIDLQEFFTNFGACRFTGGLNLAAKMLGLPGKMDVRGDSVLQLYREGKLKEINDYCVCDTLDTYFVFLRTRVVCGELSAAAEKDVIDHARTFLIEKAENDAVAKYFATWDAVR